MEAELYVEGDEIVLATDDGTLGTWTREELTASRVAEGYLLVVEGEELIFDTESEELILVLGRSAPASSALPPVAPALPSPEAAPFTPSRQRRRAPKPEPPKPEPPKPEPPKPEPPKPEPVAEEPFDILSLSREPTQGDRPHHHPLAVATIVLGICGMALALMPRLVLVSLAASTAAIATGVLARLEIKRHDRGSSDMAVAGIVLGGVGLVMGIIVALT